LVTKAVFSCPGARIVIASFSSTPHCMLESNSHLVVFVVEWCLWWCSPDFFEANTPIPLVRSPLCKRVDIFFFF